MIICLWIGLKKMMVAYINGTCMAIPLSGIHWTRFYQLGLKHLGSAFKSWLVQGSPVKYEVKEYRESGTSAKPFYTRKRTNSYFYKHRMMPLQKQLQIYNCDKWASELSKRGIKKICCSTASDEFNITSHLGKTMPCYRYTDLNDKCWKEIIALPTL